MHARERWRVPPGGESPLRVFAVRIAGRFHHRPDVVAVVDPFDLGPRRRAWGEYARIQARERTEAFERVVHADETFRLQRMVLAVDVRGDARVPHEPRRRHFRTRSSVTQLNA